MANILTLLMPTREAIQVDDGDAQVLRMTGDIIQTIAMHAPRKIASHFALDQTPLHMLYGLIHKEEDDGFRGDAWEMAIFSALSSSTRLANNMTNMLQQMFGIPGARDVILFALNVANLNGRFLMESMVEKLVSHDAILVTGLPGRPVLLRERLLALLRSNEYELPMTAKHLDRADLFVGNATLGKWVAVSVKRNYVDIKTNEPGIQIAIYRESPFQYSRGPNWYPHPENSKLLVLPTPYFSNIGQWFDCALRAVRLFIKHQGGQNTHVGEMLAGDSLSWKAYGWLANLRERPIAQVIQILHDESKNLTGGVILTSTPKICRLPQKKIFGPNGEIIRTITSSIDITSSGSLIL